MRRRPLNFDAIGLGLLALVMASWEITLSKGQEWDWLGDQFGRIQTLVTIMVCGFGLLLFRELRIKNPIVNFRVLRDRKLRGVRRHHFLRLCGALCRQFFAAALLQTLFGYDATGVGPGDVSLGRVHDRGDDRGRLSVGRGADARWLIPIGLVIVAIGNYWMSLMNLDISPWQAVWPRVVLAAGLSFIFAPLNVAAFKYISPQLRGAAVGMLALLRNEGGSVGTSMAQTIQERREQFHTLRLNEHLDSVESFA